MAKASLVVATIVDLGIAALLIGVSGFLFGGGPQSMNAGAGATVVYAAGVIACIVAPVAGFVLNGSHHKTAAQFTAWLPSVGALAAILLPAPY